MKKTEQSTVTVNPHSVHVLGAAGSPLHDIVLDCGKHSPVVVVRLTADLVRILHNRLNQKLTKD